MKDNFSAQAKGYAQYRPTYPEEMIKSIASLPAMRIRALDVATGNGQVAVALAKYFDKVYAIDISEKQLQQAPQVSNVSYSVQPAELTNFPDRHFDLITVAQAIHWFDFGAFYKEAHRLLKTRGVLAVMGYGNIKTNPHSDAVIQRLYKEIVGPYWDAERRYVDENYETIPFEMMEEEAPGGFENRFTWSFEQLTGYLNTWSAVQHYIKANGTNPVDLIKDELKKSWAQNDGNVVFPLFLRVGRVYRYD
ncbi:SAM-dependent methyltransferase [Flavobacterium akiainvivens]|uniref:SAM-dependent methyltransferase n=1 Tax=Flavobacterium akiainvivens TaxID=1202724 RepID=A0A0M8MC67_9FLAO|nr:class I SAM-dependent methyltransferase [Flavobacterium akiainvivens]KOS08133.1 SAM-dependent methyltransferase [Flavobacterium akiainvivens]SFQ72186.1 Ubiquinone/menaquinone biosynthesis C-methylase UbiE [Flavobacterium akiainvivens]